MAKVKLDKIDRIILKELTNNGRMTNVELAEKAGISAPPCLRRVRALEENDIIEGYHARLDPVVLGYNVIVYANVGLENQNDEELQRFIKRINDWDMVRESYITAGDFDFLLKIVAKDWDDYQKFLTVELTATPNVKHVKSMMAVKKTKHLAGVPIES